MESGVLFPTLLVLQWLSHFPNGLMEISILIRIEVPSLWRNSPRNSTGCSDLNWQPPQPTTLRETSRWNESTKNWNSIYDSSPTKDKMNGLGYCHLRSSSTTTKFILPPNILLSSLTPDMFCRWALNQTNHMESVNEFKDQMKDTLEEVKVALAKSKDDMMLYYNWKWNLC